MDITLVKRLFLAFLTSKSNLLAFIIPEGKRKYVDLKKGK